MITQKVIQDLMDIAELRYDADAKPVTQEEPEDAQS